MKNLLIISFILFLLSCEDDVPCRAFNKCGNCIEYLSGNQYIAYADSNWSLYNWIINTTQLQDIIHDSLNSMGYNWDSDVHIIGTHHLDIVCNNQNYSSDCLYDLDWTEEQGEGDCILPDTPQGMPEEVYNTAYIPALIENGSISAVKDCDFYENIGKYDQFVAGWEGILDNYVIQFIDVGDTTEIIITSPIKEEYLNFYNSALDGNYF